jgi:all-trans-retinol 13,14-reductase
LHGVSAALVPFRFHASVIGPYLRSASTLEGGGESLVAAFKHQLKLNGVDIFCDQRVQKFHLCAQDKISGVELGDGQVLKTKTVVSTIHPSAMVDCLPPRVLRPIYRKRLSGLPETHAACLLFARCRQPLELLHGSNIYLFDFNRPAEDGFPFDNNLCYLTAANGINSSGFMAIIPTTMASFTQWLDSSCGRRPPTYYAQKKQIVDGMLEHFCAALPLLQNQVDRCELATPLTMRDYMYSPDGALYGAQRHVGHYPLQATTRVAGLYLSGQALVAPGVMGAMISAFNTCGTMLGRERLIGELKQCN